MLSFLIRTVINAVALLVIANVSQGAISVQSLGAAILVAVILGVANATVKPILTAVAKAMTCALSCLTLGLWSLFLSFIINGFMFWLAAQFVGGFKIHNNSFIIACWGALALAIVNALATVFTRREDRQ